MKQVLFAVAALVIVISPILLFQGEEPDPYTNKRGTGKRFIIKEGVILKHGEWTFDSLSDSGKQIIADTLAGRWGTTEVPEEKFTRWHNWIPDTAIWRVDPADSSIWHLRDAKFLFEISEDK